jgi:hypothetical protein
VTYAPNDLLAVRSFLVARTTLDPASLGIVGDPAHAATGGYHEGNDDLARVGRLNSDYSKRESTRDRPGTNAASALDIGDCYSLHSTTKAIVDACRAGDPRTRDIREVIYTLDDSTVQRWDRLGIRSTGDGTHLWHTHISFFRDSEGRRDDGDNFLGLLRSIFDGPAPQTPGGKHRMFLAKTTTNDAVWFSNGLHYRPVPTMDVANALVAAGAVWLPAFASEATMYGTLGRPEAQLVAPPADAALTDEQVQTIVEALRDAIPGPLDVSILSAKIETSTDDVVRRIGTKLLAGATGAAQGFAA